MSQFTADFSGAFRKTQVLFGLPKAVKRQATVWSSETVKLLKRSAAGMQKSGRGRKTGQLARNVGMEIVADSSGYRILIGTGVGRTLSVKYARIQDEGGTITKKNKMLAIPLPGIKGSPSNYPGAFVIRSKKGNVLLVQRRWKKVRGGENYIQTQDLMPLFVLKDKVTLPATHWFSGIIQAREPALAEMMKPEAVRAASEQMVGGGK